MPEQIDDMGIFMCIHDIVCVQCKGENIVVKDRVEYSN